MNHELASLEDLRQCYRLLLGRDPDTEGWKSYAFLINRGELTVSALRSCFLTSPEFKIRMASLGSQTREIHLVKMDKFKIYVSSMDSIIGQTLAEKNSYEPHVTRFLEQFLEPGMVFLDLGANVGYFSLLAACSVGSSGKVLSFEPSQHNCALLHLSAEANGLRNIEVFPFAAAEKETTLLFDDMSGNGIIADFDGDVSVLNDRSLVRSVRLDKTIGDVERLDVIKVDIEGAEHRALSGAMGTIRKHRPVIVSEYSPTQLASVSKVEGLEYLALLVDAGYSFAVIGMKRKPVECGKDIHAVHELLERSNRGHIEIVAYPGAPETP